MYMSVCDYYFRFWPRNIVKCTVCYQNVFLDHLYQYEYQLRLGRQRQVWFIPLVDERKVCRYNRDLLKTRAIPECLRSVFTTRHYTNPHLPYLPPMHLSVCHTCDPCLNGPRCHIHFTPYNTEMLLVSRGQICSQEFMGSPITSALKRYLTLSTVKIEPLICHYVGNVGNFTLKYINETIESVQLQNTQQTFAISAMHWSPPAYTLTSVTARPAVTATESEMLGTGIGVRQLVFEPSPSWPLPPRPNVYSRPDEAT